MHEEAADEHEVASGKSSELMVAGELLRQGVDVYLPCVDDQAIDLVVRIERPDCIRFYDIQIKSVAGYNRIIGVKSPEERLGDYILILHYRHADKEDEFFFLTRTEILLHHLKESPWGDLIFNKEQREKYNKRTLSDLACVLLDGSIDTM